MVDMDSRTPQQRHANMAAIYGKDTKAEMVVRRYLWGHGFWLAKIQRNQKRDLKVQHELAAMGWHSITIWECELKSKVRKKTLESLAFTLNKIFLLDFSTQAQGDNLQDRTIKRYEIPEEEPMMATEDVSTEYGNKAN